MVSPIGGINSGGAFTQSGIDIDNELSVPLAAQKAAQEEFIAYQVASQNQNLEFEARRESVQQIETVTEAAFDESEKYRANIASSQA